MPANRRDFLRRALGASTLLGMFPTVPEFLCRAARAAGLERPGGDTILVVVQLAGGNDGLNTIVPYADDHYARSRHTLRLTGKDVLRIDPLLGFHPGMPAFARLFQEGRLTVVQGVGYPHPNQSHETSMRIWQTARPEDPAAQTGWLGGAADVLWDAGQADVPAMYVGQIAQPFTLHARTAIVPSIRAAEDCTLRAPPGGGGADRGLPPGETGAAEGDSPIFVARQASSDRHAVTAAKIGTVPRERPRTLLEHVERAAAAARVASRRIEQAVEAPTAVEYPPLPLAAMLRAIAQLIRADVGIRIYHTELGGEEPGGFDNHANQRDNHASLLRQLSQSVGAFVDDLWRAGLLDRVLLMTFSEFGRTLAENGRRGTDHGSAAPMFLAGGKLRGGLAGPHPDLSETDQGGVRHHTDFRRVYATVLDRWLGLDSRAILGGQFAPLDLFSR
jgi:uncharacterized protein (DUF1501 family)